MNANQNPQPAKQSSRAGIEIKNKAERKVAPRTLAVGDVLVASWGYDQTNYDYYEVTRLVGSQSVEIREIGQSVSHTGYMRGDCVPLKGKYISEPMIKRVNNGAVKVRDWGLWARKKESTTEGGIELFKPDHFTAYA